MSFSSTLELAAARGRVGFHEGADNDNPFSAWQGLNSHNPWCASFACWAAASGGFVFPPYFTFGSKGDAYCPYMQRDAITAGLWRDKTWRAAPGDFVLYDWTHDGVLDHIEIVVFDDGVNLATVGGNVSDGVNYRKRDRTYVAGFVALSASDQVPPPWKVKPMFVPPFEVAAALGNPDGGAWLARDNGTVLFVGPNGEQIEGGMTSPADRTAWSDRHVAHLEPYVRHNGHHGYRIFATDGGTVGYVPSQEV